MLLLITTVVFNQRDISGKRGKVVLLRLDLDWMGRHDFCCTLCDAVALVI